MSEAQQYLYQIRPTRIAILTEGPTPREADLVAQHFAYLENLLRLGVVILAGRTLTKDDETFGTVIFKAQNEQEALTIMRNDPAVEHGVMTARLYPYQVFLVCEANAAVS